MFEDEDDLIDRLLDNQYQLIQQQEANHKNAQRQLLTKYGTLTQSNHLELKHLNQYQILDRQHLREQFNMQIKQVLIFNGHQRYKLINQQNLEKNQLKDYHKFEQTLMFKKNEIEKQLKKLKNTQHRQKHYQTDSQIEITYQKLEQIKFQKEEICQNIILLLEKKKYELSVFN